MVLPKPREDSGKQLPRKASVTNTSQLAIKKPKVAAAAQCNDLPPKPAARVASRPRHVTPTLPIAATKGPATPVVAPLPPSAPTAPANPRQALLASLTDAIRDASGSGDMGAARIAMEALAKLIGDGSSAASPVVDLAEATRKRRG